MIVLQSTCSQQLSRNNCLTFLYCGQDFERERKWKLNQAKKVAIRVSRSKLDVEARENRRLKVRFPCFTVVLFFGVSCVGIGFSDTSAGFMLYLLLISS